MITLATSALTPARTPASFPARRRAPTVVPSFLSCECVTDGAVSFDGIGLGRGDLLNALQANTRISWAERKGLAPFLQARGNNLRGRHRPAQQIRWHTRGW